MNLSFPLLFARNTEKYVEKSVAFITKCFIGTLAFYVKCNIDVDCLNGIEKFCLSYYFFLVFDLIYPAILFIYSTIIVNPTPGYYKLTLRTYYKK